jgi:hypothetical protein
MNILTPNAIKYTLGHLFRVAGVSLTDENIIISEDGLLASVDLNSKIVNLNISTPLIIQELLAGTLNMNTVSTADGEFEVPVILQENFPFAEVNDEVLQINADIISLSFIMLSRYEELIVKERDQYGRFEYKNSIAAKYNFIDFPIVDEYAMILKSHLRMLLPKNKFIEHNSRVIPTHDIDEIIRFSGIRKSIKTILGDIYIYKNPIIFFKSLGKLIAMFLKPNNDPYLKAIIELVNLSSQLNLISEFYFMGASSSKYDCGYDLNSTFLNDIFKYIRKNKMVVGLHGGFNTYRDQQLLNLEKEKLEHVLGNKIFYGRQHYLRFDVKSTFQILELNGIKYDSTLGYAEREGYRCGTCHEFFIWDLIHDKNMKIIEKPLIVMDTTLIDYRRYSVSEAFNKISFLNSRCNFVGGNFVILWHNRTASRNEKWYRNVYSKFLIDHSSINK